MSHEENALTDLYPIQNNIDLDFSKANTFDATHRMHSFGAKFPPQLADWAINNFSDVGDVVLDPMVGSGTTLVEAIRLRRNAFGSDIDPLARLISKVKSTPINPLVLSKWVASFEIRLRESFDSLYDARTLGDVEIYLREQDASIPDFPNRNYWFLPEVQEELALLVSLISKESPIDFKDFLFVVFSATIITKGKTSVANVMDLAHSRPHFRDPGEKPDVLARFIKKLHRLKNNLINFSTEVSGFDAESKIIGDDAQRLPIPDDSVDLIFTSPPYVNAIDYPRAHKFSVFWLPMQLGVSADEYRDLGREYIGSERVPKQECVSRLEQKFQIHLIDYVISQIGDIDVKRAGIAHKYFETMSNMISEACRVLKPQRYFGIVVAPSNIKSIYVPTHQMLAEIGAHTNILTKKVRYTFSVTNIHRRVIDDSKRQLPFIRGEFGPGMRDEFVVILKKIAL